MLEVDKIYICGDRLLVKQLKQEEKIGSFYVPESVSNRKEKRRKDCWKAEVLRIGSGIDEERLRYRLSIGDIVYCDPVSLDCPKFDLDNGDKVIIITQDDLAAIEVKETK